MILGLKIARIYQNLISQHESLKNYLSSLKRIDNNDLYDHLFLIVQIYERVIKLFINLMGKDLSELEEIEKLYSISERLKTFTNGVVSGDYGEEDGEYVSLNIIENLIKNVLDNLNGIDIESLNYRGMVKNLENNNKKIQDELYVKEIEIEDIKNEKLHEIFEDDSKKFKRIARLYESAFYTIVLVLIFYFLGLTFYIGDIKLLFIDASFPNKIHGDLSAEFYIQKISLLILSTTLAAFLLKRSFMNRRLADDAYRTAKELDALPRYMKGMPDDMQDKIRFDLAYKYFGNGIHHESYTGGENLMHENIKANTDFIRAMKETSTESSEK